MASLQALEALFVDNADFDKIEKSLDVFCPFEAIGMIGQEIRHAYFLGYCLDPQRPHGFGSECLRAFMRSAADAYSIGKIRALDVHLMDLEQAQVRREWRRIDLVIVIKEEKLIVAIELKIDASEHNEQLKSYRTTITQEWPEGDGWRHIFLFLTKAGLEPSQNFGQDWQSLELATVAAELDGVVEKQIGSSEARALLASYLTMLRRHHLNNENLKEVADKLWSQHREALDFLMDQRPDATDGVFSALYAMRTELAASISKESKFKVNVDDSSPNILRFAVTDWDDLPDFRTAKWTSSNRLLLIEVQPTGDRVKKDISARFVLGPAEPTIRLHYYNALSQVGHLTKRKTISGMWTRLRSEKVATGLEDENFDTDKAIERTKAEIIDYVIKNARKFDEALKELQK